jgi:hypothetical protein
MCENIEHGKCEEKTENPEEQKRAVKRMGGGR